MIWFVHFLTSPVLLTRDAVAKGMSFGDRFSWSSRCNFMHMWFVAGLTRGDSMQVGNWNRRDAWQVKQMQEMTLNTSWIHPGRDQIPLSKLHFQTKCAHTWSLVQSKWTCRYTLLTKFRVVADCFQKDRELIWQPGIWQPSWENSYMARGMSHNEREACTHPRYKNIHKLRYGMGFMFKGGEVKQNGVKTCVDWFDTKHSSVPQELQRRPMGLRNPHPKPRRSKKIYVQILLHVSSTRLHYKTRLHFTYMGTPLRKGQRRLVSLCAHAVRSKIHAWCDPQFRGQGKPFQTSTMGVLHNGIVLAHLVFEKLPFRFPGLGSLHWRRRGLQVR